MASLSSRCLAEGVGTFLLVYFGTGAAVITLLLAAGTKPAAAFNVGIGELGGLGDWLVRDRHCSRDLHARPGLGCACQPGGDHCPVGDETVPVS